MLQLKPTLILAIAAVSAPLATARAQHFSRPPAVDLSQSIGEPVFRLPRASTSFGAVTDGDWVYVLGGYTGPPHNYYREAQSPDFLRVSLTDYTHMEMLPHDGGVQSASLESYDGQVIKVGGLLALNDRGEEQRLKSLSNVSSFDPVTRVWTDLPPLPVAVSSHDSAVVGSTLLVVGGWAMDPDAEEPVWSTQVHSLDLDDIDAGWKSLDAPFLRRALASAATDEHLYVLGGMTSEGSVSSRLDILDLDSGEWTQGPEFPGSGFGIGLDVLDGSLVASGSDGVVFGLDTEGGAWERAGTLTFPRFFHQIVATEDGDAYFLGGTSRGRRPSHVERMSFDSDGRSGIVADWTIPSPSGAKNRQALFVDDGYLYAFGGNNSTAQHDFEPGNFVSSGHRLSLSTLRWSEAESLPLPRQSMQTIELEDGVRTLAVGGFAHDGETARTFSDGFVYDHKEGSWSHIESLLPAARSQYGLASHGDSLWIFGGLDYDSTREEGDHFRHPTSVLAAEVSGGEIRFRETDIETLSPRRAYAGAKHGSRFYMVGGMRENFQLVESCSVFDFESQTIKTMPAPSRPRLSGELVPIGERLYLVGGSSPKLDGDGLEPNPSIEVFDITSNSWSTLMDEIPVSPRHLRAMDFRGRLMLVSTQHDGRDQMRVVLVGPDGFDQEATVATVSVSD